ncbi:hypothetical protein F8M41_008856 [Gigaspora margarita]|uniref:Putative restriction endonuclease domain-containing protein n=1 Tax=Gigaspora margarita TaxID=4874 RepID=A0A8H3X4F1_GIGMA|nr:hypothetical protein F8M41_008856 [Gigaspora margarita]
MNFKTILDFYLNSLLFLPALFFSPLIVYIIYIGFEPLWLWRQLHFLLTSDNRQKEQKKLSLVKGSDSEILDFLMSLDPPRIIIPDCNPEQFEKFISVNSRFLQVSLIKGQLEIMPPLPVHYESTSGEFQIMLQVGRWCDDNENLVGLPGSSQSGFRLRSLEDPNYPNKRTILSPDCAVVLKDRWNSLTDEDRRESFPPIAPNFIVELRSKYDSARLLHEKMEQWVNAGVDEAISLDFNKVPSEVRIYSFNPDTNAVVYREEKDPVEVRSQVLEGFVLNMQQVRKYVE